jgi:hypothetical protein
MGWVIGSMRGSRTFVLINLKNVLIHSYSFVIESLI